MPIEQLSVIKQNNNFYTDKLAFKLKNQLFVGSSSIVSGVSSCKTSEGISSIDYSIPSISLDSLLIMLFLESREKLERSIKIKSSEPKTQVLLSKKSVVFLTPPIC